MKLRLQQFTPIEPFVVILSQIFLYADVVGNPREDSYIKTEEDARRKIKMKPLREANVGVAQA